MLSLMGLFRGYADITWSIDFRYVVIGKMEGRCFVDPGVTCDTVFIRWGPYEPAPCYLIT